MADNTNLYTTQKALFEASVDKLLDSIENRLDKLVITEKKFNGDHLKLEDGTVYVYSGTGGVRTLKIEYPEGNFLSTILFSTASSGNISISFPSGTTFAGSASYEFFPGENWELSIHNKIVAGSQLF